MKKLAKDLNILIQEAHNLREEKVSIPLDDWKSEKIEVKNVYFVTDDITILCIQHYLVLELF